MRRLFQDDKSLKTEGITEFLEAAGIAEFLKDTEVDPERLKHYSFRINKNVFTGKYLDAPALTKSSYTITVNDENHVCVDLVEKRATLDANNVKRWSIYQKITEFYYYEDDAVTVITGKRIAPDFIKDCYSIADLQEISGEQDVEFEADIYPIRKMPKLNHLIEVTDQKMDNKEFKKSFR